VDQYVNKIKIDSY